MYSAAVVQEALPRRQEPWIWAVQGLAIRSWPPPAERIIKADPLVVTGEAAEELNADHSMLIRYLKQTGKVKKLKKWMPHVLCAKSLQLHLTLWNSKDTSPPGPSWESCLMSRGTKKKKTTLFWSVISSYSTQQQWTISWSDCDMWPVIWQPVMASSVQSQICTKKRSQSLFGGLLPIWSTTAFWNPAKPWHLKSMLSKLMRCTKNCNSCSRHWSTETAQFFSTTMAGCMSHANASKVERTGLRSLPHLPYSPDLSPTTYHFFRYVNNFLQGKCFHSQ